MIFPYVGLSEGIDPVMVVPFKATINWVTFSNKHIVYFEVVDDLFQEVPSFLS